jgi:uncharacterized coiled-coil protein SlyX
VLSEKKLSTNELRGWLEEETRSILSPVHNQAKQLLDEMRLALQNEAETSKMLLDNSNREIERRNMRVYGRARALNKLARLFSDRLKKITVPEQVSYDLLNKFAQDTQRVFIVADVDIKNWFPRISPFFIIDRRKFLTVHEKAKLTLNSLNDFVAEEYVRTKTLEETFQLIDEVQSLELELVEIEGQEASMVSERAPIEKEIAELQQRIAELETKGPIDQLNVVETEKETLSTELKHQLRHLQKPFVKVQALASQGGGAGLTPDELKKLNDYMETPLEALAVEEVGYPMLKQILQKLSRLMEEDKLKLKSDKARKAAQSVNDILKRDSLARIHAQSVDVLARRNQLLSSSKLDEIKRELSLYQDQLKLLNARKTSVETHEAIKVHAETDIQDKIRNYKRAIEKNVYGFLGKKIEIL